LMTSPMRTTALPNTTNAAPRHLVGVIGHRGSVSAATHRCVRSSPAWRYPEGPAEDRDSPPCAERPCWSAYLREAGRGQPPA
jgi:hypothetical protein